MSALLTKTNNILIFSILLATITSLWQTTMAKTIDNDWWQHAVIYQIYPRSFMDSNDDGVGDLRGIISKLPYLAETGITATWLSPIFASPMVDFGYDISNFTAIQPEYGTMQDFEDLIDEANKLGIKILLDFVPNHSSDQCEWFVKSAARVKGYEDFYVWADGKVNAKGEREPPNNWQSVFYGSAWTWHPQRQQYYLHQFTPEQPDLNYRNVKVIATMDEVIEFWLNKGVSGFRIDAVNHLFEDVDLKDEPLSGKTDDPNSYGYTEHIYTKDLPEVYDMLHHWRQLLDDYTEKHGGAARIMMTEAYADIKPLMDYYENAAGRLGAHFPFNFNFITELNATADARDFVYHIQKWLTYMPPPSMKTKAATELHAKQRQHVANWVMGNHDNPRLASRFGSHCVDLMNMLLMTLPGVAVTYNGEELGMEDYRDISYADTVDPPARNVGPKKFKEVSRDPERTPFQWSNAKNAGFSNASKTWLPVHPNYLTLNLAQQLKADKSHYKVYKALVALRKMPVLAKGALEVKVLSREVFALKRCLKGQAAIITIINIGAAEQQLNLTEFLNSENKLRVLVADSKSKFETGHEIPLDNVRLTAHEGVVCMLQ